MHVFKPGDKYRSDFDDEGMLKACLKLKVTHTLKHLTKMHTSLESMNYHTVARPLWAAMKAYEIGDMKSVATYLKETQELAKKELDDMDNFIEEDEQQLRRESMNRTEASLNREEIVYFFSFL